MSQRRLPNLDPYSEPTSSDVEEDNLHENLNEFERNILNDEEININKDRNGSNMRFNPIMAEQSRGPTSSHLTSGILFAIILFQQSDIIRRVYARICSLCKATNNIYDRFHIGRLCIGFSYGSNGFIC